jgi:hypothetical protein
LWLQKYINPIQDNKDFIDWGKFLDKHIKQPNKSLPTSNKTEEELFDQANSIIEKLKRSKS